MIGDLSFAAPGFLALLALAPLAAAAYMALDRWRRRAAARFAPGRDGLDLSAALSLRRRALKAVLIVLAVAAIALALAQPRIGRNEELLYQTGADVVIALDVSRSMLADDVAPDRLARAEEETLVLLDELRGHRVGLVIFARSALLRSPLTTDTEPLRALLQSARKDSELMVAGSDLGAAVRTAAGALEEGEADGRAIIVVTDGEDHERDALAAGRDAAQRGIALYAAGIGTAEGAVVPPVEGEPVEEIITRLDEELLRRMTAASPGGAYVSGDGISELATEVSRLEQTPFAADRRSLPIERFQWVVLVAFALLVVEALLPERSGGVWPHLGIWKRTRPAGAVALLLTAVFIAASCVSPASDLIADGNRAMEEERYGAALEAYRQAAARSPDSTEARLNAGVALHRMGLHREATVETVRALPVDDPSRAAQIHYNLGTHYVGLGRLDAAVDSYRQALLLDPNDGDAKHNLELVLRLIEATAPLLPEEARDAGAGGSDDGDGQPPGEEGASEDGAGEEGGPGEPAGRTEGERALAEALDGLSGELTVEEALRVIDLARELNRERPLTGRGGVSGDDDRPDY